MIHQPASTPRPRPARSTVPTTDQAVRVWLDLLDTCDEFLRAGLQVADELHAAWDEACSRASAGGA